MSPSSPLSPLPSASLPQGQGQARNQDPFDLVPHDDADVADTANEVNAVRSETDESCDGAANPEELVAGIQLNVSPDLLGSSSNVLLLFQLGRIQSLSLINFVLSIFCLVYFGIGIILFILNSTSVEIREASMYLFHTMEFWSTFAFSLVDVFAVMYSPRPLRNICDKPRLLKLLMSLNVTISFVPAVLITASIERYEMIGHQIEYANELCMVSIDLMILFSLMKTASILEGQNRQMLFMVLFGGACCIVQFLVYNLMGEEGEQIAHYLEFCVDMLSAGTLFWFCMDNKLLADDWIRTTMLEGICPNEALCCALAGRARPKKE